MHTRRINLGDVELQIAEATPLGGGGRPIFLVHGFCGAKEDFTPFLDLLAALGWHAVAPDLRGHGESDHPAGPASYAFARFASDLVALADRLGWDGFTLLGHSMGGMVAQVTALAVGTRLDALILMDTGHGPVDGIDPALVEVGRKVVADQGLPALVALLRDIDDPLATPPYRRLCEIRPGYQEWSEQKTVAASPDMWLAMTAEMFSVEDRLDSLTGIGVPTLVICGEEDLAFADASRAMAKMIPGARLAMIPDGGHSPQFEAPDAWWGELTAFLSETAS